MPLFLFIWRTHSLKFGAIGQYLEVAQNDYFLYIFSYVLLLYEIEYIKVMSFSGITCILYFEYKVDKPKMTENVRKIYEVTNTDDFNNVKKP